MINFIDCRKIQARFEILLKSLLLIETPSQKQPLKLKQQLHIIIVHGKQMIKSSNKKKLYKMSSDIV